MCVCVCVCVYVCVCVLVIFFLHIHPWKKHKNTLKNEENILFTIFEL